MAPPNLDTVNVHATKTYKILPSDEEDKDGSNVNEPDENRALVESPPSPSPPEEDEEEDESDIDVDVVVPPDGGWGWMVVFGSFMCNMIVDGIIFSFGTFLPGISEEFGVSNAQVTLVGSLMSGFYLISGPFTSAIANKLGFRLVAVAGSVLSALAFVLSYFAPNVEFLYFSYGILGGIGFGLIYVPSVIIIGFYFERWRALATGIGVCGSGIGTFVFAPLSETLIRNLGWRSALLVQGAIVFSCIIFGSLFRPLKPLKLQKIEADRKKSCVQAELVMDTSKLPEATKLRMEEAMRKLEDRRSSLSKIFSATNNHHQHMAEHLQVYHTVHAPQKSYSKEKRLSVPFIPPSDRLRAAHSRKAVVGGRSHCEEIINRPLYRDDIFFGQSLTRLPQYTSQSSVQYNLAVTKPLPVEDILEERTHACKLYPTAVKRALTNMLDFSLFKSPTFIVMAVSGFFTMMGFYVPFMYLVDRAVHDMPKETAIFLLSSIGIANTLGRVLCGVLSSFPSVNALIVTNAALTVGGVATMLSGLSLSQEYQFFYTAVFGLAISCFASLRSIIVVDLLGLEKLTNAFGLLLLFQGIAATIGSPLAGAFMQATGSYDASFYLSGGMILISAVMCYPLSWVNRWERRRLNEKKPLEGV